MAAVAQRLYQPIILSLGAAFSFLANESIEVNEWVSDKFVMKSTKFKDEGIKETWLGTETLT